MVKSENLIHYLWKQENKGLSMKNTTSNNIPIFLASDDNYAPFVATTITSIVKNTKSFIDFYVLDGGIFELSKQKILSLKNEFNNFSIEFIDMKDSGLERFPYIRHYSLNTFSRYFIPELKPDLNKILYMDVDIIVKGDVAELYNQDLGNYPLGAILEDFYPHNYTYLKKICPNYSGGSNYFNAGILLLSLDYFRKNNLTQKLIDKTIELKDVLSCADQDVFNLIFENNFKIFDYKYNFMPDFIDLILELDKKEAIEATNNPVILHYTYKKPWNTMQANMAEDFWQVAKLTPFYEELKKSFTLKELEDKLNFYKEYAGSFILRKLKIKYIRYKILSKVGISKKRKRYEQKAHELKEKIDFIK